MAVAVQPNKQTASALSPLEAYKKMYLLRITEEKIADLYRREKIMSFVHFYVGQEAVAVGVADSLNKNDKMFGNHRSHGHYLAKGGDLKRMICELLGKEAGFSHGKGGSMHMIDKSVNFAGSTPILGSVASLACGSAFEQKYHQRQDITVVFIGDGAFEEGAVYETINLAGLFKLPLLIVVENNLYAVNTPLKERRAEGHNVEVIVSGFGARYLQADGNDYLDVFNKAKQLVDHLRNGHGPAILECFTYRHMAHSAPIFDESVRQEDVLEQRLAKDSVKKMRSEILKQGVTEKTLSSLEQSIEQQVDEAIVYALQAPFPKLETLYTDLYA